MNAQHLDLPEIGLSFDIPSGWTGDQYDEYILLGHQTIPGVMILFQNKTISAEDLKNLAMKGIIAEGVNLQPNGEFILQSAERVQGEYEGQFQGAQVRAFAVGLINSLGAGMNAVVLTTHDKFSAKHIDEVLQLVDSVKFYEARDAKATTEWKQLLIGKKLKYTSSNYSTDYMGGSTGTSQTVIINLYADGTFYYYSSDINTYTAGSTTPGTDNNPSGFGAVGGQDENRGKYTFYTDIKGSFLILNFSTDKILEFKLATNSKKKTTLNGVQYYVMNIE